MEIRHRSLKDQHLTPASRAAKFGVKQLFCKCAVIDENDEDDEDEQNRTWLATLDCVALLNGAVRVGPREHVFIVLPARDRWGSATSGCARSVRVAPWGGA